MDLPWFAFKALAFALIWSFSLGLVAMIVLFPFSLVESGMEKMGKPGVFVLLSSLIAFALSTTQGIILAEAVMQSRGRPVDLNTSAWALVGLVFTVPIAMTDWSSSGATRSGIGRSGIYGGLVGYVATFFYPVLVLPAFEFIASLIAQPPA